VNEKTFSFIQRYSTEPSSGLDPAQYNGCSGEEVRRGKAATWQFPAAWCCGRLGLAAAPSK